MRDIGWVDLRSVDQACVDWQPDDTEVDVAFEALMYLALDSTGRWNQQASIVLAVLTFLTEATGVSVQPSQAAELRRLLGEGAEAREAIAAWFDEVYP